ncbi:MAG TPA: hypothetical protein VH370_13265 [Humisphaera sp.]|jgi:hypothetical protein|nr:hypothetical protein [Humisphaera sp.]
MPLESAILDQIIQPARGGFSAEHARYVLSLEFTAEEHARYAGLSAKAQEGSLTSDEERDLDEFLSVNTFLMILQSKARVSLVAR